MDIFISWSGKASHTVGLALKEWLPSVIQSIEPFISSEDIAKGTRWFSEIETQLGKSNFGIICLTPENYAEPWILFEAGAISKCLGESSVAPILLGMSISDLKGPLAQFNATQANKEDILKLLKSINEQIDTNKDKKLDSQKLEKIFDALWPELEEKIKECQLVLDDNKTAKLPADIKRPIEDILEELVELNRNNTRLITELPIKIQKDMGTVSIDELSKSKYRSYSGYQLRRYLQEEHSKVSAECSNIAAKINAIKSELSQFEPISSKSKHTGKRHESLLALEKELQYLTQIFDSCQNKLYSLTESLNRTSAYDRE